MRKKILLMLSVFTFAGIGMYAQTIEGGAGVIHTDGDPNGIAALEDIDITEGHVALDTASMTVYFYDDSQVAGAQWIPLDVSNVIQTITVDAAGTPELTATTVGGVTTLSFESDATIVLTATDSLYFYDTDGDATGVDLADFKTSVEEGDNSITVTGTGTVGDPYEISLTGADGAGAGTVPVTDGSGNLTWTNVVESFTLQADGTIDVTTTDGTTTVVDLDGLPPVVDYDQIQTRRAALPAGESAFVKAADNNTFGMPANGDFGVIFVINSSN